MSETEKASEGAFSTFEKIKITANVHNSVGNMFT